MKRHTFDELIEKLLLKGAKFCREVYYLIKEVLDFALDLSRKSNGGKKRHVSGREILEAFRSYVLKEFGPMSITVLREWNLHRCEDVGAVVFELIEEGVFGRDASDDISDFDTIYDFEEEFRLPFIPSSS